MKIALFGDLHIFNHFGKTQFEDIAQSFLIYLFNYCKKNQINQVRFLGDWFHIKNKLYVPPFIKSIDILRDMKKSGIELTFLIGNHDAPQMGTTDHSIMYAFREYGKVVPLYDWEDIDGVRLHYLSYVEELPRFEYAENNILLAHLDIKNFAMDNNFICSEGFSEESFEKFKFVFSGHFHRHQIRNNIVYVGSPYQTRFSERFDKKGFIILDTQAQSWQFQFYQDAPVFKEVSPDSFDPKDVRGNFVRVRTHKKNANLDEIKTKLLALGAESIDFIFEDEDEAKELNMIEDLTMGSMNDLASAYYDNVTNSKLFDKSIQEQISAGVMVKDDFMTIFREIEEADLTGWKPDEEQ